MSREGSRDGFRGWARAMLAHYLRTQPCTPSEVFQVSTMNALLEGIYDGDVTIAELMRHGDFGLGTFNHLDGEMVVLDGVCYHLRADGSATVASPEDRTPFAAVLRFRTDKNLVVSSPVDRNALTELIDQAIPSPNLMYGLRVTGTFSRVRTRTVIAQRQPYPPLIDATANEPVAELQQVTGTLAGFRTPAYEQGISVAGYHMHFLSEDRHHGGHVLDFELIRGEVGITTTTDLHLTLPRSGPFITADLSAADSGAQIRKAEGG